MSKPVGLGYKALVAIRKKTTTNRPPSATAAGRFTILLEQIQEQNRATIEAVLSVETKLRKEIQDLGRSLTARIEALEDAVA